MKTEQELEQEKQEIEDIIYRNLTWDERLRPRQVDRGFEDEAIRRYLTPEELMRVAQSPELRDKYPELYLTVSRGRSMRLWSRKPEISFSGHPDWGTQDCGIAESSRFVSTSIYDVLPKNMQPENVRGCKVYKLK
jgi:hypothetical protein